MFVTFADAGDETNKPGSNQCYLPPSTQTGYPSDTNIEFAITLGVKKLTTFPIGPNAADENYWRLQQATGATLVKSI